MTKDSGDTIFQASQTATIRKDEQAAIAGLKHRNGVVVRQPLLRRPGRDVHIFEAIQAFSGSYPETAFTIFINFQHAVTT